MQVIATKQGFIHGHLKDVNAAFDIPDDPARKLTADDDEITVKAATKGKVPVAFSSHWMIPASMRPAAKTEEPKSDKVDLNAPVI